MTQRPLRLDSYVVDTLMRDLVGHDRAPSAFVVYLWLWRMTQGRARKTYGASLGDIAGATGLSKSSVQNAVRRLTRRRLIAAMRAGPTLAPVYAVSEPWKR
ncbi:MAG: helix-turn-helix domain-containing protein [Caulobacteraceae bacterium]